MNESDLIRTIVAGWRDAHTHVRLGPGDDACVIRAGEGRWLLATVDHLIEGRHYAPETDLDLVARKAVARSVSDLAAMGSRLEDAFALATAAFPPGYPQARADELARALARHAEALGIPIVGGDIASFPQHAPLALPPLPLTLTVMAAAFTRDEPVLQSGARAGDALFVTGPLGGAWKTEHHLRFMPRLKEAAAIRSTLGEHVHAMMDISDGLGRDAARMARASGARIEIDAARLPVRAGFSWRDAMGDGEDYELLVAVADESHATPIVPGVELTRIGRVSDGSGECVCRAPDGEWLDCSAMGFEHG